VTCASPPPVFEIFQFGAWVTAKVTDGTSGAANPIAQGPTMANTSASGSFTQSVTGADRAGNRTTVTCEYQVVVPACNGQPPTILGNAQNNVISGTGGRDVIAGLGGADSINGLGGNDVICGGDGPDSISGGDGNDWIDGGAGSDSIRGDSGRDTCISGEVRTTSCEL
jgi:Ca2+-binding RTX toxin-like protein